MLTLLFLLAAADLTPPEANKKVGETVTVRLTVREVGENEVGFLEAYSEKTWSTPGCFYVRIPKTSAESILKSLGVKSMLELRGTDLRVTGKVERLDFGKDGKYAAIVAGKASQIEVVSKSKPLAADLTPAQANKKVGQSVTMKMTVLETGMNGDLLELYSEKTWNIPGCVFVRIPKASSGPIFNKLGVESHDELAGYDLRITGKAERLDFGASGQFTAIVASKPEQVEVVARPKRTFTATDAYTRVKVSGFDVLIHPDVIADKKEHAAAMKELRRQLDEMPSYLPEAKLTRLKKVRIWMQHRQKGATSAAAFHPDIGWLRGHNYNPEMVNCVEISHSKFFVDWAGDQPYMVLHELAHAYHYLVLGVEHEGVKSAYKQAMDRKLYDKVKRVGGTQERAYATTNRMEYFAELTEAYFGKNDFFPFNRAELKKHDPVGYALMEKVWGEPKKSR